MNTLTPEELEAKAAKKGRRISPLGQLIRDLEVGQTAQVDTIVDSIKNPLSAYAIAKSVGRKVKLNKLDEVTWAITRVE